MINANELRLGNWINYAGHPVQCSLSDLYICDSNDLYSGIHLTEERLLLMGFEKVDLHKNLYKKSMQVSGGNIMKAMVVYLDEKSHTIALADYWTGSERLELLQMDYQHVHTIQNLYFVLTGEELEIKDL